MGLVPSNGLAFRAILKSRQIGATYYFAREALVDALKTGRIKSSYPASKATGPYFQTLHQGFCSRC